MQKGGDRDTIPCHVVETTSGFFMQPLSNSLDEDTWTLVHRHEAAKHLRRTLRKTMKALKASSPDGRTPTIKMPNTPAALKHFADIFYRKAKCNASPNPDDPEMPWLSGVELSWLMDSDSEPDPELDAPAIPQAKRCPHQFEVQGIWANNSPWAVRSIAPSQLHVCSRFKS